MLTHLNLIDVRRVYLRKTLDLFNMGNAPITDSNAARLAVLKQFLQGLVYLLSSIRATTSSMHQEQIHISILAIDLVYAVQ